MADKSAIEWTDATWNPIRGCSRVSEGCRNCYAERTAIRHAHDAPRDDVAGPLNGSVEVGPPGAYHGLVKSTPSGPRWTGEVRFVEDALTLPLRWKTPRRVFVNSMSDLFHEKVAQEWVCAVFNVMARCPQHTFQVLTKRPARMLRDVALVYHLARGGSFYKTMPLPNVWLGVSVENQAAADERIPLLLQTPAAVRWVSAEPLLGPVEFGSEWNDWLAGWDTVPAHANDRSCYEGEHANDPVPEQVRTARLDWIVTGGESGPGARPCDVAWIRSIVAQCRAAGTPAFVKQMGRWVLGDHTGFRVNHWLMKDGSGYVPPIIGRFAHERPEWAVGFSTWDRKGGDPNDWPEDLRVREVPR